MVNCVTNTHTVCTVLIIWKSRGISPNVKDTGSPEGSPAEKSRILDDLEILAILGLKREKDTHKIVTMEYTLYRSRHTGEGKTSSGVLI